MGQVAGWGLWNERLTEWFNPGGKRPYARTKEEAVRWIPLARRQYPMGKWEAREYVLEDDDEETRDQPGAARRDTETAVAHRLAS